MNISYGNSTGKRCGYEPIYYYLAVPPSLKWPVLLRWICIADMFSIYLLTVPQKRPLAGLSRKCHWNLSRESYYFKGCIMLGAILFHLFVSDRAILILLLWNLWTHSQKVLHKCWLLPTCAGEHSKMSYLADKWELVSIFNCAVFCNVSRTGIHHADGNYS